jgi:hypothetical protein
MCGKLPWFSSLLSLLCRAATSAKDLTSTAHWTLDVPGQLQQRSSGWCSGWLCAEAASAMMVCGSDWVLVALRCFFVLVFWGSGEQAWLLQYSALLM